MSEEENGANFLSIFPSSKNLAKYLNWSTPSGKPISKNGNSQTALGGTVVAAPGLVVLAEGAVVEFEEFGAFGKSVFSKCFCPNLGITKHVMTSFSGLYFGSKAWD